MRNKSKLPEQICSCFKKGLTWPTPLKSAILMVIVHLLLLGGVYCLKESSQSVVYPLLAWLFYIFIIILLLMSAVSIFITINSLAVNLKTLTEKASSISLLYLALIFLFSIVYFDFILLDSSQLHLKGAHQIWLTVDSSGGLSQRDGEVKSKICCKFPSGSTSNHGLKNQAEAFSVFEKSSEQIAS